MWMGAFIGLYLGWNAASMIGGVASAQSRTDPIQGVWKLEVMADDDARGGGAKDFKDTLDFHKDDVFTSTHFKEQGIKEGKYETDQRPFGPAKFDAKMENKAGDKIKYSGVSTGQNMEGTLECKKKDGTVLNYKFKGERK
jgi:hypothetical protein